MHVCMYVYVYVGRCVCMYVHRGRTSLCMFVCIHKSKSVTHMYIYIYAGWRTFDARCGDGTFDFSFVKRPRLHVVVSNLGYVHLTFRYEFDNYIYVWLYQACL